MEKIKLLKERINHMEKDLISAKKTIIRMNSKDKKMSESAWKDMAAASKEISRSWKGMSVVEEIREQREKN